MEAGLFGQIIGVTDIDRCVLCISYKIQFIKPLSGKGEVVDSLEEEIARSLMPIHALVQPPTLRSPSRQELLGVLSFGDYN